jgi:ectoine hydroxylase-related dioxygenase (phytanoyl-CoA dioxygenase family)
LQNTAAPIIVQTSTVGPGGLGGSLIQKGHGVRLPGSKLVTEQQRRELDERGFYFTDVLFSADELAPVRSECIRLYHSSIEEIPASNQGHRENQRLRPFLPAPHKNSETIARFQRHPVFQELAREIIGPDVDQTWSQGCLKLPDVGAFTQFPFHQDGKFAEIDRLDSGISCFLGLGPLSPENGTLYFAAHAHETALPHTWDQRLEWWSCSVDGLEVVPGTLSPGQMVVYRLMTPHGSPPNVSDEIREAFLITFNVPGIRLVETGELFGDQQPLLRGGQLAEPGRPVGDS